MKVSTFLPTHASRAQGWIFLVLGFSMFSGFLYAAIISKFLPASENHIVAAIQKDRLQACLYGIHSSLAMRISWLALVMRFHGHCISYHPSRVSTTTIRSVASHSIILNSGRYYCFLVPLTLPIIIVAVYFHWLSMKLFKHA